MIDQQRILGIDFGAQRIGLSMSDPLGILATPYETVRNDGSLLGYLKDLFVRENVCLCVVGMPTTLKGAKGPKAKEVEAFVHRLKEETNIPIVFWDERYTTSIARQTIREMHVRKKGRNAKDGRLDAMAAAIILQGFLDSRKKSLLC